MSTWKIYKSWIGLDEDSHIKLFRVEIKQFTSRKEAAEFAALMRTSHEFNPYGTEIELRGGCDICHEEHLFLVDAKYQGKTIEVCPHCHARLFDQITLIQDGRHQSVGHHHAAYPAG